MLGAALRNLCASAPEVTSISKFTDEFGVCFTAGWELTWRCYLSGELSGEVELYVEKATNATGDNWSYMGRYGSPGQTQVDVDHQDVTIGTNGTGGSTTRYHRIRVWVVPIDAPKEQACSGPDTSAIASRTGNSCVE